MNRQRKGILAGVATALIATLVFIGCPEESTTTGTGGGATYPYTCTNGDPASGTTTAQNTQKCQSCDTGFTLASERCTATTYPYICTNGTAADGTTETADTEKCSSCTSTYKLVGDTCTPAYTCENGTAADGTTDTADTEKCTECDAGYTLSGDTCTKIYPYICTNGTKSDGTTDTADTENCTSCTDTITHTLTDQSDGRKECIQTAHYYTCTNGTKSDGTTNTADTEKCTDCDSGYTLDGNLCEKDFCPVIDGEAGTEGSGFFTNSVSCRYSGDVECPKEIGNYRLSGIGTGFGVTCTYVPK